MVKFCDVVESTGSERLDFGRHLVKISDIKDQTKDGDELLDDNGVTMWNITFENNVNSYRFLINSCKSLILICFCKFST